MLRVSFLECKLLPETLSQPQWVLGPIPQYHSSQGVSRDSGLLLLGSQDPVEPEEGEGGVVSGHQDTFCSQGARLSCFCQ